MTCKICNKGLKYVRVLLKNVKNIKDAYFIVCWPMENDELIQNLAWNFVTVACQLVSTDNCT